MRYAISRLCKFPDCAEHTLHTRSVFTWIEYHHFVQYGFVLEAYKLNSWLGISEKIVALFHPSTVTFILLSDDGKLVRVYLICWHALCTKGIDVVQKAQMLFALCKTTISILTHLQDSMDTFL